MTHPIPTAALDQHIAILGKTRAGKSSVMRVLVEGLLDAGKPVCIVDPKGALIKDDARLGGKPGCPPLPSGRDLLAYYALSPSRL